MTTLTWGVWGAFTSVPSEHGFPDTLTYVVWALTMIAPASWALRRMKTPLARDRRSIVLGLAIGLLGAGGQMLLFQAVTLGPDVPDLPHISLSPVITIALSSRCCWASARASSAWLGIVLAVLSLPLFDYSPESGAPSLRHAGSSWRCSSWSPGACRPTSSSLRTRPWSAESIFFVHDD